MPETDMCEKVLLVQAEFDGELDAIQSAEMETHRSQCARCQKSYDEMVLVRGTLHAAAMQFPAPAHLREALTRGKRSVGEAAPLRSQWFRHPAFTFGVGAALAASLMLAILPTGNSGVFDQVLASHVRALQPGHLEDVVSTDHHTVKPWFDGRIDFAPPVKDLAAQGFPLDGARLDYLAGRPVAALVYVRGKHPINLYVWPSLSAADAAPTSRARNGYNTFHFVQGEMTVWVISDLENAQLAEFVQLWRGVE